MFPVKIYSVGDPVAVAEKDVGISTTLKPEKEPGAESRSTGSDSTRENAIKIARRADETVGTRLLSESATPSFSELLAMTSTDSFDEDSRKRKAEEEVDATTTEYSDIVTINDSEDSICEIPVPPKPEPLTVYLEDSTDSTSSDSDTDSEIVSEKRLPPSRRSSDRNRRNEGAYSDVTRAREPTVGEGARESRPIHIVDTDETSDSDGSTTEYDEENWGIVIEGDKNREKDVQGLGNDDINVSRVPENVTGDVPEYCTAVERYGETLTRESRRSSERSEGVTTIGCEEVPPPEKSLGPDRLADDADRLLSAIGRAAWEHGESNYGAETGRNISEDGTLILNVTEECGSSHLEDDRERETTTKAPESRKRSMMDGERKSNQSSPVKKAKNSDDRAEVATSSGRSLRVNEENRDKARACAADYFFQPMSGEMKDFYNDSWGGENFDVDAIRRQMPRDSRHWTISNEDLLGSQRRRSRYWTQMKCRNCNETGHGVSECTQQKKLPSCHMCGESGHREPRCPHKRCLGCGSKQKTYVQVCDECRRARCGGCRSLGHDRDNCPDLWRRYHLTTSITDVNTDLSGTDVMKPQHLLNCCNCAKRGHDSAACNSYRWSRHFPTPAYVTDYTTGPAYVGDFVPGNESFPPEADARLETEERATGSGFSRRATQGSSFKSQEKKKRDKRRSVNPVPDPDVGYVDETMERPASEDALRRGRARRSGEPAATNSESREGREMISLKFESKLLDDRFRQAADFGVCKVPLSHEQYESLAHCDISRQFLLNLTLQFPVNIEIRGTRINKLKLLVSSTQDLYFATRQIILGWLKWPVEERNRFVSLNLPTTKRELVELLSPKLDELNEELGDPFQLYEKVQSLKCQLGSMQRQTRAGKKPGLSPKRARVVGELASLQCRLNMILIGQAQGKKSQKSCKYLRTALADMQKAGSPSNVRASTYLRIVHHYNRIFAAYTPDDIHLLLRQYTSKSKSKSKNKRKSRKAAAVAANPHSQALNKILTDTANDKNHVYFLKSPVNETANRNLDAIPPSSISPNVSSNKTDRDSRRYFDCCVESHFQPPILGLDDDRDPDANWHRPKPQTQSMCDSKRNESNYYGSKYDFGTSSKCRTRGNAAAAPKNLGQKDYIPLENEPRDLEKTSDNYYGGSSGESRPCYQNESTQRDRGIEGANVGFGRMFYVDKQDGSAGDSRGDTTGISPRNNKKNRRKFNRWVKLARYSRKSSSRREKYSNLGNPDLAP